MYSLYNGFGEYHDQRNSLFFSAYDFLPVAVLEQRYEAILSDPSQIHPDLLELSINLGPFAGTAAYGVIRSRRGRIIELHVLNHPKAYHAALLEIGGCSRTIITPEPTFTQ